MASSPVAPRDDPEGDTRHLPPPVVQSTDPVHWHPRLPDPRWILSSWSHFRRIRGLASTNPRGSNSNLGTEGSTTRPSVNAADGHVPCNAVVDEVVVDRSWSMEDPKSPEFSDMDWKEPSIDNHYSQMQYLPRPPSSLEQVTNKNDSTCTFRSRIRSYLVEFFSSRFPDPEVEADYRKDMSEQVAPLKFWTSLFFITNWILEISFVPKPVVLADKIFYFGVAPAVTFPLTPMYIFRIPSRYPILYQFFLCLSVWSWSFYQILYMVLCGYYNYSPLDSQYTCGAKNFLSVFYYMSALQTIALFGACLKRLTAVIGAGTFLIFYICMVFPNNPNNPDCIQYALDFIVYHGLLLYLHYRKENASRRLFSVKRQLNLQFERTRMAQINERNAADSKRRLTSYVFHVRIPLNTALLAVQNMGASGTIDKDQDIEFKALEGSLSMMSKVLNDILDFNRMDSGRLESVSQPYVFHQAMQSMFIPLQLATNARGLELVTDLDKNIDHVARRAEYRARGLPGDEIEQRLIEEPSGVSARGTVAGDETRLRQIVTNLASNACKFTPPGGKLTISTRLVVPTSPPPSVSENVEQSASQHPCPYSAQCAPRKNSSSEDERIVVRIEVKDTGWGIRSQDMEVGKLFSAFCQTEQGRLQGGKGTGLGLALVRLIVKLSGGRLGVKSKLGEGSTFWVELPLGVGTRAVSSDLPASGDGRPTPEPLDFIIPPPPSPLSIGRGSPLGSATGAHPHITTGFKASVINKEESVRLTPSEHHPRTNIHSRTLGDPWIGAGPSSNSSELPSYFPSSFPLEREHPQDAKHSQPTGTVHLPPVTTPPNEGHLHTDDVASTVRHPVPALPPGLPLVTPGVRVLVVDDDSLTRTLMKRMLTRMGCNVSTAENGKIAVDILLGSPSTTDAQEFSVVFMDNQMPVMSGLDAISKLRQIGRRDFVVGVTGNALLADQQEYLEAGVDHILTKPVLEKSLKSMLLAAAERRTPPAL